ncbi:hypothetical protein PIN17_A1010 [Prevotella intermedia 17]|nr:hypothetical protein PIN17_A1010 [Prevotella intermedia 17]
MGHLSPTFLFCTSSFFSNHPRISLQQIGTDTFTEKYSYFPHASAEIRQD